MFLPVAAAIVVFIGALLLVIKFLVIPALERGDPTAQARGVATLGALQTQQAVTRTQQALAPQPTAQPAATPRPVATAQPAAKPAEQANTTIAPAAAVQPNAAAVGVSTSPTAASVSTTTSSPQANGQSTDLQPTPTAASSQPTSTAGLDMAGACPAPTAPIDSAATQQLLAAHQLYWSERTLALRDLDISPMEDVAVGKGLTGMQQWIDDLRSKDRAISTHVRHHVCVLWAKTDQAVVSDEYEDLSVYIDPISKQPLDPSTPTPQTGPIVKVRDLFQSDGGTWKWAGSEFYE